MPAIKRVVKPITHRGKRSILKREPQLIEDGKQTLCIKGSTASQTVNNCMKDLVLNACLALKMASEHSLLHHGTCRFLFLPEDFGMLLALANSMRALNSEYDLKKPNGQLMQKNNPIRPFEDATPIEQFCRKLNAPLFMFVSHNKKRPNNLIMGRTYEHSILDMAEFGVDAFKSLKEFKLQKIAEGTKPMLIFNGDLWENNHQYGRIKNLMVDMFQMDVAQNIRLQGLEHVLCFTAIENSILVRSYRVLRKKSGTRIPRIELIEIGPRVDLNIRRTQLASDDLFKQSCKKPKDLKVRKKKNISKDKLGSTFGRIHMGLQNINSIQTRKMKGLKKTLAERKTERKLKALKPSLDLPK